MNLTQENLRIVILESPYFTLRESALARDLFGKIIGVRLNSYLQDYGEGVMPVGKEDFLSDIVIICHQKGEELTPVYSFKITHLESCKEYKFPFPIVSMLEDHYRDDLRLQMVKNFVVKNENKRLAYFGSRCKSVEIDWSESSGKLLNGVGICALVKAKEHFLLDSFILFAMFNQGAYRYCEKLGMKKLFQDTAVVPSLASTEAYVMYHDEFSAHALNVSEMYSSFWENRIHIGMNKVVKKAA